MIDDGSLDSDIAGHLLTLYNFARFAPGRDIVELGVRRGVSTRWLLMAARDAGDKVVHSVDSRPCSEARAEIERGALAPWWRLTVGDTRRAVVKAADVGLVLHDACHTEAGLRAEWDNWAPRLRVGAFAFMHDVAAYPAVAAFLKTVDWPRVVCPWTHGMAILQRPEGRRDA